MTAARLRLVDEAKKGDAAKKDAAKKEAAGTRGSAKAQSQGGAAPASGRQGVRRAAKSEPAVRAAAKPKARAGKRPATVADVMRSPAVCCGAGDTLHEAARRMWERDVGAIVVVDEQRRPLHVITDRDVCMGAYTQGLPLWAARVGSLLPRPAVCCALDAGLAAVRRVMEEHGVRRVPVVGESGAVEGVVGLGDLLREATAGATAGRARGLTPAQLTQTLAAVYADVPAPVERARAE